MNTKHTPGPWVITNKKNSDGGLIHKRISGADGGNPVCTVFAKSNNEHEANAKLMAAAPELLEALIEAKEVLLQLDHRHNGKCYNPANEDCDCTLCRIDKVIKKATE